MSPGWNGYIATLLVLNLAGCAWLLWWTSKRRPGDPKPEDTSHYWDGDITEYNKPMPRWWINGFFIALAFGVGYLLWFGGIGTWTGFGKWSSQGEHDRDKAAADARLEETFAAYRDRPLPELSRYPQARELVRSIFANTCATCHGSSAQGAIGYPNLSDDIWHWGGSPERVLQTVLDGREGAPTTVIRRHIAHLHGQIRRASALAERLEHLAAQLEASAEVEVDRNHRGKRR